MTAEQWQTANRRMQELQKKKPFPEETMTDLKRWWHEKLAERREGKIITLPWV